MQKVRKSAHCIQLITPQERFISQLSNDDSSVDGESSGDEIAPNDRVDNANRKKEPPTAREIRARRRARGERRKEIDDMMKNMPPRRDLLVLEYMPNGDLFALIQRLAKHRREHGALLGGIIPNRVLWSFWLCRRFSGFHDEVQDNMLTGCESSYSSLHCYGIPSEEISAGRVRFSRDYSRERQ